MTQTRTDGPPASSFSSSQRLSLTLLALAAEFVFVLVVLLPLAPFVILQAALWGGSFAMAFGLVTFLFLWWVVQPSPGTVGKRTLQREEAPALFQMVENLCADASSPPINRIVLDHELNAAAYQTGGFLSLIGSRRTLILGIPLLRLLSTDEVKAVIAHELGHFSRNHGRLGHWIYRVRAKWDQYLHLPGESNFVDGGLKAIASRFVPYFVKQSAGWSRQCEFEADAVAARITSARQLANALARLEFVSFLLAGKLTERLNGLRMQSAQAPGNFWDLVADLTQGSSSVMQQALSGEARRPKRSHDTHPPLRERVSSLGLKVEAIPLENTPSAGEMLLGGEWLKTLSACNEDWQNNAQANWRFSHLRMQWLVAGGVQALFEQKTPADAELAAAIIQEQLHSSDSSLALLSASAASLPEKAIARFYKGLALLERGDATGVTELRQSIQLDKRLTLEAQTAICNYLERYGDQDEINTAWARRQHTQKRLTPLYEKLWATLLLGQLRAITSAAMPLIAQTLSSEPSVDACWAVQLDLPDAAGLSHTVNVLVLRIEHAQLSAGDLDENDLRLRYQGYLQAVSPPDQLAWVHTVYTSEALNPRLLQQLQTVPGAVIIEPTKPVNVGMIRIDSL